jgi:hypothetical protein
VPGQKIVRVKRFETKNKKKNQNQKVAEEEKQILFFPKKMQMSQVDSIHQPDKKGSPTFWWLGVCVFSNVCCCCCCCVTEKRDPDGSFLLSFCVCVRDYIRK